MNIRQKIISLFPESHRLIWDEYFKRYPIELDTPSNAYIGDLVLWRGRYHNGTLIPSRQTNKITVAKLRKQAKDLGIKRVMSMRKQDLINALKLYRENIYLTTLKDKFLV